MRAFICDACGNVYRPYFSVNGYGEGNMLTIVKSERDGKLRCRMRLELCQDCMRKTHDLIAEQLVMEGSPADKKYYEQTETAEPPVDNIGDPEPIPEDESEKSEG